MRTTAMVLSFLVLFIGMAEGRHHQEADPREKVWNAGFHEAVCLVEYNGTRPIVCPISLYERMAWMELNPYGRKE